MKYELISSYTPAGDQPKAIKKLANNFDAGKKQQILLGATGTGKTFTMANLIKKIGKKTLIIVHNKTLAGQLYSELKELFPKNKVEYFVSYYDYYQPEAYVAKTDTYIQKDASINEEIDELRHAATSALLKGDDTIVVASVSCIYGIGEKSDYINKMLTVKTNEKINRDELINKLVEMQYERNNVELKRGSFRVRGDIVEIAPIEERKKAIRLLFFDNEIEKIDFFDPLTGEVEKKVKNVTIFPASHFVIDEEKLQTAIKRIEVELEERLEDLKKKNKLLEYQRLEERTKYDLEMLRETGFCAGIENYSRHLSLREQGETPTTLIDFLGDDFLMIIDESHVTIPQIRGMYNGDRARKQTLVDYGFRLPSALDNRPLTFSEFEKKLNKVIYLSATPGEYELTKGLEVVEQIIRPTGLLDPIVEVRASKNQIDDLIESINETINRKERTLITTLTIRMAEEMKQYLQNFGFKVAYMHNEIKTLERLKIIRDLRLGKYDVLVGINLLREGLDIPEVSLIAIMDADKEGFLRSGRSLIQTIGRAARNKNGRVIMYADKISAAMASAIAETERRRKIQMEYNEKYNIQPVTIKKEIRDLVGNYEKILDTKDDNIIKKKEVIAKIEKDMKKAAENLDFEKAAKLRDMLFELKEEKWEVK